jgi:hypothetical protein
MAKRYSYVADEYRKKLADKMQDEFIAGVAIDMAQMPEIDHPAVQKLVNDVAVEEIASSPQKTPGRPHLRVVK